VSLKAGDRIGLNTKDRGKKERPGLAIAVHSAARSDACAVNSDVKIVCPSNVAIHYFFK
jgi:hypothetical protein